MGHPLKIVGIRVKLSRFMTSYKTNAPSTGGVVWPPTVSGQVRSCSALILRSPSGTSIRRSTEITPSSETFLVADGALIGLCRSNAHCTNVVFPAWCSPTTASVISRNPSLSSCWYRCSLVRPISIYSRRRHSLPALMRFHPAKAPPAESAQATKEM